MGTGENRHLEDPFVEKLDEVFGDLNGKVKSVDAWSALEVQTSQRTQDQNARLGAAMRDLGFGPRKKLRFGERTAWGYQRGEEKSRIYVMTIDGRPKAIHKAEQASPEEEPY